MKIQSLTSTFTELKCYIPFDSHKFSWLIALPHQHTAIGAITQLFHNCVTIHFFYYSDSQKLMRCSISSALLKGSVLFYFLKRNLLPDCFMLVNVSHNWAGYSLLSSKRQLLWDPLMKNGKQKNMVILTQILKTNKQKD